VWTWNWFFIAYGKYPLAHRKEETMRLFVDDIREPYPGWIVARTITDAIRILATQDVEVVSLDHDIQQSIPGARGAETFEPVARYIKLMGKERPMVIEFHTGNPIGGQRMADIIGIPYYWVDYYRKLKEK
jgi:hypothetical protein